MRSPERHGDILKLSDDELPLRYLSPGAFTILSPNQHGYPPDPPTAPSQYRLTPTSRRSRNQSFAIIAEPTLSRPGSRSPSPSGRVSPFRGRGFNPIGSRHASPIPSPTPPHDERTDYYGNNYRNNNTNNYGNTNASKAILSPRTIKRKQAKLSPQLSKSLTNIGSKTSNKPPPSPRRTDIFSKAPAFQQLSPITGSSPDTPEITNHPHHPHQQQQQHERKKSSSSKIPRSRSQPPSRKPSPNTSRSVSPKNTSTSQETSRPPSRNEMSRNGSKNISRNQSRNPSRSQSPNKGTPLSPTRGKNKYSNIQSKVNSFSNRSSKPKVPQKPNFDSEDSVVDDVKDHKRLDNKNSELKRAKNKSNLSNTNLATYKTSVINRNINIKKTSNDNNNEQSNSKSKTNVTNNNSNNKNKKDTSKTVNKKEIDNKRYDEIETVTESSTPEHHQTIKKTESDTKLNETLPSTVVSSTTSTATQPLKIDAKLELNSEEILKIKPTPMYMDEGRVLSATSVSTAINRMNDTVLDSQTLMKDHNFTKLSPAATAIISMSEINRSKLALDPKTATTALPVVDNIAERVKEIIDGTNNTTTVTTNSNLTTHPNHDTLNILKHKNNINKMNSVDNSVGLLQNVLQETGSNGFEGRLEGRTVIAKDVKPIRITVKEKPMDPDVQSGNVRLSGSIVNGSITGVRPSLPPPQQPENAPEQVEEKKPSLGARILSCCKCCKKKPKVIQVQEKDKEDEKEKVKRNIFDCCKKKKSESEENITEPKYEDDETKKKCWDRLKCCRRTNKSSVNCCPFGKKKDDSWAERRNTSNVQPKRNLCARIFRKLCCLDSCRCCKKKPEVIEDPVSRRESMMSKKKSLTPTATVPVEEPKSKIDISLVEHTSLMRGAIPVLPVSLAWFCLVFNVIFPGTGTIFSGMFCLCIGKPRFSQKDGARPRIGSFIINIIIGIGQLFTVLFCLVGWGWSIWWGVIMLKVAKKHVKLKLIEESLMETATVPVVNQNHLDPERGGS